jgi:hypothetical protein
MSSYFAIKFYVNNICTQEVDFKQFLWKNFPLHNGDSEYVFYRGNAEVQIPPLTTTFPLWKTALRPEVTQPSPLVLRLDGPLCSA